MAKREISLVILLAGVSLALPARAATYNYSLQVGSLDFLSAWSLSWQSDSLTIPTCGPPGSYVTTFTYTGEPVLGYEPTSVFFCLEGPSLVFTVTCGTGENFIQFFIDYSAPPAGLGAFKTTNTEVVFGSAFPSSQGPVGPLIPGPPASLSISQNVSWPGVPRWNGTVVRAYVTAGPATPTPGTPVEANVGFLDTNGNSLEQLPPIQIVAGQVASFELDTPLPPADFGQHVEVVPVISALPGQALPPLQLTAEVVERSNQFGKVFTSVNGFAAPSNLAPQGLAGGQTMRLTATAYQPNTCNATLSFADAQGNAIGPNLTVDLAPGQSQSLDLTSAMLNLPDRASVVVQPTVALQAPIWFRSGHGTAGVYGGVRCLRSDHRSHPDVSGSQRAVISSQFPKWLRRRGRRELNFGTFFHSPPGNHPARAASQARVDVCLARRLCPFEQLTQLIPPSGVVSSMGRSPMLPADFA
jgi:hypothetical protein